MWYELFHVLPHYAGSYQPTFGNDFSTAHYVITTILYANWLGNLFRMILTQPYDKYRSIQKDREAHWLYCKRCLGYSPPRSHHCPVCNVCVLKRDHHCWFSGCCVGFHNHRFYLVMILNCWIATLYANVFHWTFLGEHLGGHGITTWLCVFLPHCAALFGLLTIYQFCVCLVSLLAILCLVMFTFLLQIQIMQLYNGQTKYERKKTITLYNLGWKKNAKDILGHRWLLVWICPWITSHVEGRGFHFRTKCV